MERKMLSERKVMPARRSSMSFDQPVFQGISRNQRKRRHSLDARPNHHRVDVPYDNNFVQQIYANVTGN